MMDIQVLDGQLALVLNVLSVIVRIGRSIDFVPKILLFFYVIKVVVSRDTKYPKHLFIVVVSIRT